MGGDVVLMEYVRVSVQIVYAASLEERSSDIRCLGRRFDIFDMEEKRRRGRKPPYIYTDIRSIGRSPLYTSPAKASKPKAASE